MATLNYAFKELSCKIVYYGCGLCGKTTNLIHIHKTVPQKFRGELVSLATEQDRTLFFDFLPLDLGEVKGFKTKFQLYTVPGQVYYNATRKLVLRGVDGLVFVVDSQRDRFQENIDSLENLKQNLAEYGYHLQASPDDMEGIPWVLQYNKRDMPQVSTIDELNQALNQSRVPTLEAVAVSGQGVKDTLKGISSLVIKKLNADTTPGAGLATEKPVSKPAATTASSHPAEVIQKPEITRDDEYDAIDEQDMEESSAEASKGQPRLPNPKGAASREPAAQSDPASGADAGPSAPPLHIVRKGTARVRGVGLGTANLTLANLVGGETNQFQMTGKVSYLGIFGSTWSRKLRYLGQEQKNDNGSIGSFHKLASDDDSGPKLDVFVKNDADKALYVTYVGGLGEVHIVPPGKKPLG